MDDKHDSLLNKYLANCDLISYCDAIVVILE
jgi:hypothetical protein